jgi:hypothetical protein
VPYASQLTICIGVMYLSAALHCSATDNCEKLGPCFPVKQEQASRQQQWQQQGRSPDGSGGSNKGSDALCLPKFFTELSGKDIDDFLAQLWAMDGRVYGNCAGTCWMKQVGCGLVMTHDSWLIEVGTLQLCLLYSATLYCGGSFTQWLELYAVRR